MTKQVIGHAGMATATVVVMLVGCISASKPTNDPRSDPGCKIERNAVASVSVGDSTAEVMGAFAQAEYATKIVSLPGAAREILVQRAGKLMMRVTLDGTGHLSAMKVYDPACKTEKGIGPGSSVASVAKAYGRGNIASTDGGYVVHFEYLAGMMFLIENDDLPPDLKGIPDDVLSEAQERQILSVDQARIAAVEVFESE